MWEIFEHGKVPKQLKKLPIEILRRYEKWKDIVRLPGPQGLQLISGFNDESLKREWEGFRSSRLNSHYRVIYQVQQDSILIKVIRVTAHDYKKR